MSKSKLIFLIIGVSFLIFLLVLAYEVLTEDYCWDKGRKLSDEEKRIQVEPTDEEKGRGVIFQSKYYRTISDCEKQFPKILFR